MCRSSLAGLEGLRPRKVVGYRSPQCRCVAGFKARLRGTRELKTETQSRGHGLAFERCQMIGYAG